MKNIIILYFFFSFSLSQVFSEYSYVGASQAAMVGSISSYTYNDGGLFQNPASIAGFKGNIIVAGQSNLFNQSYLPYRHFGLIYDIPIIGKTGLSYQSFSTDYNGVKLSSENALSISKGVFLQKDKNSSLALGYRINMLSWEQAESSGATGDGSDGFSSGKGATLGLDFGIIGSLRDKYWVGGYLGNINSPIIEGQNLPRKISISLGFSPVSQVYTNLSMERLLGRSDRQIKLGIRYDIDSKLSLLSGVQSNPNRFGLGIEYRVSRLTLSYSILTHHIMSETHNFEIKIK